MTFVDLSEILGNLGEFVGAFGVMTSLIYVGFQIKMTRNVVMADSHASVSRASREMYLSIAENPHLAELLAKENTHADADELMMQSFWVAVLMRLEDTYTKFEYGLVEPHAMRQVHGTIRSFAELDGSGILTWTKYRNRFSESFGRYVDSVIEELKS